MNPSYILTKNTSDSSDWTLSTYTGNGISIDLDSAWVQDSCNLLGVYFTKAELLALKELLKSTNPELYI